MALEFYNKFHNSKGTSKTASETYHLASYWAWIRQQAMGPTWNLQRTKVGLWRVTWRPMKSPSQLSGPSSPTTQDRVDSSTLLGQGALWNSSGLTQRSGGRVQHWVTMCLGLLLCFKISNSRWLGRSIQIWIGLGRVTLEVGLKGPVGLESPSRLSQFNDWLSLNAEWKWFELGLVLRSLVIP